MKAECSPSHADLTIVTVPHPVARQAAAFLQAIMSAGNAYFVCDVVTSEDCSAETAATVYVRPEVIDALDLAVMAEPAGTGGIRKACSRLAELDERWGHLPRLSLEHVITEPYGAARLLSHYLGMPLEDRGLAEIETRIDALRRDVAGYEHPLAFLASVEPSVEEAGWVDHGLHDDINDFVFPETPRHILILAGRGPSGIAVPLPDATGWIVSEIPIDDSCAGRLRDMATLQGIIHLHHVDDAATGDLLNSIMKHLHPRGLLSGEERSEMAVEGVVSRLTRGGGDHGLAFLLSGNRWLAVPQSWRR